MAPTSIDGNDISGATIDGQDVSEITADGDTVFSAGPKIIDDFERGNLNPYAGNVNNYTITSGISGSHAIRDDAKVANGIYSTSGLPNYPSVGDTIQYEFDPIGGDNLNHAFLFGVQSADPTQNYRVSIRRGDFAYWKNSEIFGSGRTSSTSFGSGYSSSHAEPYRCTIDWNASGWTWTIFDANDNEIGSYTENDTDYTSGGIGFHTKNWKGSDPNTNGKFDNVVIL